MRSHVSHLTLALMLAGIADPALAGSLLGTTINKAETNSATSINAADLNDLPDVSAADILDRLPGLTVNGVGTATQDPATGRIQLRGLGSNRALVLVDGRRQPNGYVFPNATLPAAAIERIEVCREGAAAVYGSDAVAGVINVITTAKHTRTGLATETGGTFVNPAASLDFNLKGIGYGSYYTRCLDVGRIMPLELSVGLSGYRLDGSGDLSFQSYLGGLGVTGIGGVPGVFINSPTDLETGFINVERYSSEFSTELSLPLDIGVYDGLNLGRFDPMRGTPSVGVTSVFGGFRLGQLNQDEQSQFNAYTPAFGLNGDWLAEYDTQFDGQFAGVYAGVEHSHAFEGPRNSVTTLNLGASLGFDLYKFDVREQVDATGLGGALNYSNTQVYDFTGNQFRAGLTASIDWSRDNLSLGTYLSLDWGKHPEIGRSLPDSDAFGALDPVYSLDGRLSSTLGIYAKYRF